MDRGTHGLTVRGRHLDDATLDELTEYRLVARHQADLTLGGLRDHERRLTGPETAFDGDKLDGHLSHVVLLRSRAMSAV